MGSVWIALNFMLSTVFGGLNGFYVNFGRTLKGNFIFSLKWCLTFLLKFSFPFNNRVCIRPSSFKSNFWKSIPQNQQEKSPWQHILHFSSFNPLQDNTTTLNKEFMSKIDNNFPLRYHLGSQVFYHNLNGDFNVIVFPFRFICFGKFNFSVI
jgi:hypothetical protein